MHDCCVRLLFTKLSFIRSLCQVSLFTTCFTFARSCLTMAFFFYHWRLLCGLLTQLETHTLWITPISIYSRAAIFFYQAFSSFPFYNKYLFLGCSFSAVILTYLYLVTYSIQVQFLSVFNGQSFLSLMLQYPKPHVDGYLILI